MMTNKLAVIENQLERINTAINNTVEYKIENHEKRIGKLEDEK